MPAQPWVALALITTGAPEDAPLEVAAVRFRSLEPEDTFERLVRPPFDLPHLTQRRTGLGPGDVADAPTLAEIHHDLVDFLGNDPIVGERPETVLERLAMGHLLLAPRCDLTALAVLLLPSLVDSRLAAIARSLGLASPAVERAVPLARLTQAAFLALWERAASLPAALQGELARLAARAEHPARWFFQRLSEEHRRTLDQSSASTRGDLWGIEESRSSSLGSPPPGPRSLDIEALAGLLGPMGPLARRFPAYEERPQQSAMLRAVAGTFNEGGQLLVEAGTGTGKSLAYLLPAVAFAALNKTPVVVSTNTLNLQEQLARKDLPDLLAALADDDTPIAGPRGPTSNELLANLRLTTLKGRANYACGRRVIQWRSQDLARDEAAFLLRLLCWLPSSPEGDRAELRLTAGEEALWGKANAAQGACDAGQCQTLQRDLCFVQRARRRAEGAHVVITNHALLLSDLATENRILPDYDYLVLDEAHHLEEVATRHLGFTLSQRALLEYLERLSDLVRDGRRLLPAFQSPLAAAPLGGAFVQELAGGFADAAAQLDVVREAGRVCFVALGRLAREHAPDSGDYDRRLRLTHGVRAQPLWEEAEAAWLPLGQGLRRIVERLDRTAGLLQSQVDKAPVWEPFVEDITVSMASAEELCRRGDDLFGLPSADTIYWIEAAPLAGAVASSGQARGESVALCAAPLHVGSLLQDSLFLKKQAVVLTSATLAVQGSFAFIQGRLGLEEASTLALGSPFDYERAALVFLPTDIPEPTQAGYAGAVEAALTAAAGAAGGRTLALFTSHAHLRAAGRRVKAALEPRIAVLAQGIDGGPDHLLASLRADQGTLLLGAASFWEGIDVVGEALSVLVVARLPFTVPSDPVFAARAEQFEEPFTGYALPQASLRLQQAFGRLIRSQTDRGVLVLLDRRLTTKAYGKALIDSLPGGRVIRAPLADLAAAVGGWLR